MLVARDAELAAVEADLAQISVELRDQFSEGDGPLADGNPAKFVVLVAKPLVEVAKQRW
jgi:hypothetical protein